MPSLTACTRDNCGGTCVAGAFSARQATENKTLNKQHTMKRPILSATICLIDYLCRYRVPDLADIRSKQNHITGPTCILAGPVTLYYNFLSSKLLAQILECVHPFRHMTHTALHCIGHLGMLRLGQGICVATAAKLVFSLLEHILVR